MSRIEDQVKELSPDELSSFRNWFMEFDAEVWDRQIEADAGSGRLFLLAQGALEDHDSERSIIL